MRFGILSRCAARRDFRTLLRVTSPVWRSGPYVYLVLLIALYLNVFVLIAQMFRKIPALERWRPNQSEPPSWLPGRGDGAFRRVRNCRGDPVPYRNGSRGVRGRRST